MAGLTKQDLERIADQLAQAMIRNIEANDADRDAVDQRDFEKSKLVTPYQPPVRPAEGEGSGGTSASQRSEM